MRRPGSSAKRRAARMFRLKQNSVRSRRAADRAVFDFQTHEEIGICAAEEYFKQEGDIARRQTEARAADQRARRTEQFARFRVAQDEDRARARRT